jgi:nicotinamidase-related amidase
MDRYIRPHFARSALLTIDMQNDFTLEDAPARIAGTDEVVSNVVRLLVCYRKMGLPIIHVLRFYLPDGSNSDLCRRKMIQDGRQIVIPDSYGADLVEQLKPRQMNEIDAIRLLNGRLQMISDNEYVMYKPRWGAFYQTGLHRFLNRDLNDFSIDTLVFAGCNFPNCPRTSIYEASERDYRVVLINDAVSQFTGRDETELLGIGTTLLRTAELEMIMAGVIS